MLDLSDIEKSVGVTPDKINIIILAATTSHWEILGCKVFVQWQKLRFIIIVTSE